jgi:hypothetical protein
MKVYQNSFCVEPFQRLRMNTAVSRLQKGEKYFHPQAIKLNEESRCRVYTAHEQHGFGLTEMRTHNDLLDSEYVEWNIPCLVYPPGVGLKSPFTPAV